MCVIQAPFESLPAAGSLLATAEGTASHSWLCRSRRRVDREGVHDHIELATGHVDLARALKENSG